MKGALEKASCHSASPSAVADKVDHREMSALRICQSNTEACFRLVLHRKEMGVIVHEGEA